jgi:hypothetical protein
MLDDIAKAYWVSASQQSTYGLCPKKWGFEKLDRLPKPPNRFAERGLLVHKVLENWQEKAIPIDTSTDAGKIAMPGIKFLPPPGLGQVEHKFKIETDVAVYVGVWDLLIPRPRIYVGNTPIIEVYDQKTTSDLKWMKTAEELKDNPQSILYTIAALWALYKRWKEFNPNNPGWLLTWVYYRADPKKPGARRVQLYILPDEETERPQKPRDIKEKYFGVMLASELEQKWKQVESLSQELLDHRRLKHTAADLPINVAGCDAFGGCPYRGDPCVLTPNERMRGYMAQQSAVEKAKAKLAAQQGTQQPETEQGEQTQQTTLSFAEKVRAKIKPAAAEASEEAKAAANETKTEAAQTVEPDQNQEVPPAGRGEPPVNPPEAERAAKTSSEQPEKKKETRSKSGEGKESFSVTVMGLEERVKCASIVASGLVTNVPDALKLGTEGVSQMALDIVDAITLKAIR